MKDRDIIILKKIIKYCEQIDLSHKMRNTNKELFFDEDNGFDYRNAISMPIQQIGELAKSLKDSIYTIGDGVIPWKDIIRMRERFAHHYGDMDKSFIWNTSIEDIPVLKSQLQSILDTEK